MSNADIMVEMIRLAEQIGNVKDAHMYHKDFISIEGETKAGNVFSLSLNVREEKKDA